MMFKLAAIVPLFSLFVSSAMAAGSVTNCFSGCMSKAAAFVGCAITDHRCVQQAIGTFKSIATQCLEDQACKTLADGTQAELESAAEAPAGEFNGIFGEGASTFMSRITPRSTGLGSLECSDCASSTEYCGTLGCKQFCGQCRTALNGTRFKCSGDCNGGECVCNGCGLPC